jgi:hypothetical protein
MSKSLKKTICINGGIHRCELGHHPIAAKAGKLVSSLMFGFSIELGTQQTSSANRDRSNEKHGTILDVYSLYLLTAR